MKNKKPSYKELETNIEEAHQAIESIQEGQVDAVVSKGNVMVLRLKAAEDALRQSELRYRTLFNYIDEGFCIIEMIFDKDKKPVDYRFIETNPAFEKYTGLTNAKGKTVREFAPEHEEHWFEVYGQVALTGQPIRFENFAKQLHRWYDVYAYRFGEAKNRQVAVLFNDITKRKRDEEELYKAKSELEERVLERTQELNQRAQQLTQLAFELTRAQHVERKRLAKILHDNLQQLLAAAKFNVSMVASQTEDQSMREMIQQAIELLGESIQVSRSLSIDLSPPILHQAGLIKTMKWLCRWVKEKHKLSVNLEAQEQADTDSEEIKLLIFESVKELLFNTVKHAGISEANILMRRKGEFIEVIVSDQGAGFDPASLQPGTDQMLAGFGLFSIKERIALIGGNMHIESAPGKGSRFTIRVPSQLKTARETPRPSPDRITTTKTIEVGAPKKKIRLLLADDHTVVRQGLSALLKREKDIEIVGEASDGEQAIEKALELEPDVILMDCSMPNTSGPEATRAIHTKQPEIRIIGLSMYEEDEFANEMLAAGASAYLNKTGPAEKLLSQIRA